MVKGFRKVVFSFLPVIMLFAGILIAPVNAGTEAPERTDTVYSASPQPNTLPVKYATPSAAVFTPAPPEIAAVPAGPAEVSPAEPDEVIDEVLVVIEDEEVPTAPAYLPQTGGIPAGIFYGFGGLVTTAGLILRMRLRKD